MIVEINSPTFALLPIKRKVVTASSKYLAFYKGEQVGKLKKSISDAEAAIRCVALKDRNEFKRRKK